MTDALWRLRELARSGRPGVRQLARLLYGVLQHLLGFYIPLGARFAGKPCFPHGLGGIYISGEAAIGRDCVIFQQVTIGSNTLLDSKRWGAPTIGDRAYLGAGAKVIGGVRIGDDVRVGAGAVATGDAPANATVLGFGEVRVSEHPRDNRFFRRGPDGHWVFFEGGRWIRSNDPLARSR